MTTLKKQFFLRLCLCVVQSVAVKTLDSIAKCNREYNQRLKDITETTQGSEGGREQRPSTNKRRQMSKKLFGKENL